VYPTRVFRTEPSFPSGEIASQNTGWHRFAKIFSILKGYKIALRRVDLFLFNVLDNFGRTPRDYDACLVEEGGENRVCFPAL
jgi:hypothetical protein